MTKVSADYDGKHILVRSDYDPALLPAFKAIKQTVGGGFWKKDKVWRYHPTLKACNLVRRYFPAAEISPALREWANGKWQHEKQLAALAAQADADLLWLPAHAPRLADALRPDQRVAAAFLAATSHALLADQPGLGKTLETIAGLLNVEDPTGAYLISSPRLSVSRVWAHELRRWTDYPVFRCRGQWRGRELSNKDKRNEVILEFLADASPVKFLLVSHEMLRVKNEELEAPSDENGWKGKYKDTPDYPLLFSQPWEGVVVDESHRTFGRLTITKGNMAGRGLRKVRDLTSRAYAVTGTPFGKGGRVQGMFGTLHWLNPREYTSFWRWADEYLEVEEDDFGHKKVLGLRKEDEGNMAQWFRALGPVLIRRTKAEVLPNLPRKQYLEVLCDKVGKQQEQYAALLTKGEVPLAGGRLLLADGTLAEQMRMRQLANGSVAMTDNGDVYYPTDCDSGKRERLWEHLEERGFLDGNNEYKIIVASQFKAFTDHINEHLVRCDVPHHYLHGGITKDSDRDRMMEDFQSAGGPGIFLLTSQTGGVSVTLDMADEVHCLDEMWNPEDNEQLEDRAHRASRMHQVTIFYYRTDGTFDTYVAHTVDQKAREQHASLDARRGVPFLREVIQGHKETAA